MSAPIWAKAPERVAPRNTWYFTVPPRNPSSVDARHVIATSARVAPTRRALAIAAGSGGGGAGPGGPLVSNPVAVRRAPLPPGARARGVQKVPGGRNPPAVRPPPH